MDRRERMARRVVYATLIGIVRFGLYGLLRWRRDVQGLEHVPRDGGAIVAFNHHSYLDFFVTGIPVYRGLRRYPVFLAKAELFRPRLRGWIFRASGQVPVARGSAAARAGAFEVAVDRLRRGELVFIAPEQTISESLELLPFRAGAVRMAQAAGVPVVPAIAWGDQRLYTKGRPFRPVRRVPVTVRYGPPVRVAPDDDPTVVTRDLQARMAVMLDEVIRSYPDHPRPGDDWWLPAAYGGSAPPHAEAVARHHERQRDWEQRAS